MQFKIDENLPTEFVAMLRDAGHDAVSVLEQRMGGASDHVLAAKCQSENRIVVSLDLDFAGIRRYPPRTRAEMIVLRVRRQNKGVLLSILKNLIALFDREPLAGRLWIAHETGVRIFDSDWLP